MVATTAEAVAIGWEDIVDRQSGLLTPEQNRIVKGTRLLMLGVGGMGMNAAAYLVRCGFERFTLVDFDVVDGTSANRTPFAFDDTLGLQKVEAARRYMLKINPNAQIDIHPDVKLGVETDPELVARLVREHDVLSWAMDGIAGRLHYTRISHQIGSRLMEGKPGVESWAIPYHLCVWTVPNAANTPTWEECFGLPTAGLELSAVTPELVKETQRVFFRQLGRVPRLREPLDPALMDRWFDLKIPNRTLGFMVAGCSALIASEMLKAALLLGGAPLPVSPLQLAPWMAIHDVRRHVAYELNFVTGQVRWRHPITGRCTVEPLSSG